ncbi:hypothetical protein P4O66_014746, partial [Electrophorus voltai]
GLCQCRPSDGNCSCCKECMLCLSTLWEDCCACVGESISSQYGERHNEQTITRPTGPVKVLKNCIMGFVVFQAIGLSQEEAMSTEALSYLAVSGMCNPRNYSETPPTSKSTVEDLHRPIPSLFRALTEGDTPINMMVVSFPVVEELSHHESLVSFLETLDEQHHNISLPGSRFHGNYDKDNLCTVVYFDDCLSIRQCKQYCESMGASKYRWFHNACCECVGPECLDYGSKAVKCVNCLF